MNIGIIKKSTNKSRVVCLLSVLLIFILPVTKVMAGLEQEKKYALISALLAKVPGFISWPDQGGHVKKKELNLCLLGANPFGETLLKSAKSVASVQKINIFVFNNIGGINKTCHILYIDVSKTNSLPYIISKIQYLSIFTVSEIEGFDKRGGMMAFTEKTGVMGININISAVNKGKIKLDSPLLLLANQN